MSSTRALPAMTLIAMLALAAVARAVDITTVGVDNSRDGWNRFETVLNPTNVPDFEAVARTGVGVFDTLKAVAKLVLTELRKGG